MRTKRSPSPDETGEEKPGQSSRQLAQTLGKFIALLLVVVLMLLIQHYCQIQVPPFGPDAQITAIDGDSLKAGNGAQYRLFGIDAPELKQSCNQASGKSWLCGRAAKARLTTLIKHGSVNCESRDKDHYGRIVAICHADGVPDLGETMVRDGYALALSGPLGDQYRDAEAEAKEAKRGLWRGSFEEPWEWRKEHPREEGD
jgi:endonuclease YncB( thermonuclease family)